MKRKKYLWLSIVSVLCVLVLWELVTDVLRLMPSYMLPSPLEVCKAFAYKVSGGVNPDGASLWTHIATSLKIALGGYLAGVVIGVPLGIAMAWYKKVDLFAKPLFDLLRPIPPLAWIPLMILWFGIGYGAKVVIIFISSMIACVVNSYAGIKQTRQVHIWVAKTFAATNLQILFRVALPTARPMILTGLKTSLGSAWMALVAAELLASTSGLGYMIQMARQMGRADIIVVGMIVIGLIGAALSSLLDLLTSRIGGKKTKRRG